MECAGDGILFPIIAMTETESLPRENGAARIILILTAFLIPVFAVPISGIPFQLTKTLLAIIAVALLAVLFAREVLRSKKLFLSFSPLIAGLLFLPAAYLVSAAFSSQPISSLLGYGLESDTFGFILVGVLLALGVFYSAKTHKIIFAALLGVLASGWALMVFQFIQVVFAAPTGLPALASITANFLGRWNDLGIFVGLIAALILVSLVSLSFSKQHVLILVLTLAASVFFLIVVNFTLAWVLAGIAAFFTLVFALVRSYLAPPDARPAGYSGAVASGAVLLIAVLFTVYGNALSLPVQNFFNIRAFEVRPSLQSTGVVLESVYRADPVLGSGPNTFGADWFLHRPPGIVGTQFWNVPFSAGFGSIPTSLITGGLLVGLAWISFIILFLYTFVRALFMGGAGKGVSPFLIAATGSGGLFLIVAHILYVPSSGVSLVMFMLFGLFLASLKESPLVKNYDIPLSNDPRVGIASVFSIVIFLVGISVLVLFSGKLYASTVFYERASALLASGDAPTAEVNALRSLSFMTSDRAYRILAATSMSKLSSLIVSGATDDAAKAQFQSLVANAVSASQSALSYDRNNFQNWIVQGDVYASLAPAVLGAYQNAVSTYEEARARNPLSPEVDFKLAQVEASRGNREASRAYAEASVALKADYTPAILFISQLALDEGNLDEAIRSVESALVFEPQNALILYQLGVLRISNKEYQKAADTLLSALNASPNYANAQFFLAEAYTFLKKQDEALILLNALAAANPENTDLPVFIEQIQEGENPFRADVQPPPEPDSDQ